MWMVYLNRQFSYTIMIYYYAVPVPVQQRSDVEIISETPVRRLSGVHASSFVTSRIIGVLPPAVRSKKTNKPAASIRFSFGECIRKK